MIECNCMIPVMNYGSSASYKAEPSPEQVATGVIPLDSLPAAWWNCMWSQTNTAVNQARQELGQLIVELNNVLCNAGVYPQDVCTDQLYQSIEKIRQTLGNATTAGAVKSSSQPSEVAIDQTTGMMSVNCLGNAASLTTSARTVVGAVNELKSTYDQCFTDTGTALSGKAPTSHVSDLTTYGVGNADCYGHLKISDTYTCDLGCTGMAASQSALYCVYDCLATIAAGVASLGNTAGCALGTAAAGTAVTAARSDHVHPVPSCVCDSAKLNGYSSAETATANTIARRNASGYLYATYYNQSSGVETATTSSCFIYANSDGWFRKTSVATVKSVLGLGSAAYCAATAFRSCTWTPTCVARATCADTHMGFMYPYIGYCSGCRHGVCFTVCSGQVLRACNVTATLRGIWWKYRPNSSNYYCCFAWLPPGCCLDMGQCWGWSPTCNCYAIYTFGAVAMV